ncbi:MAG TPA: Hsp20/alpha crystallin family protein [Anaerolineales bacterium]|nr:Hsp20/alpha crystallin family protein [Anaerolineales bacterium]
MPMIVRKSIPTMLQTRREIFHAVSWHIRSSVWSPPTDVYETNDSFVVRVEIAGMHEEDFEVAVENHILMIGGHRSDLNERRAYHQMEIRFGKFEIAVEIPVPVDADGSVAEYKDGFLLIQLPKANPKQIEVE